MFVISVLLSITLCSVGSERILAVFPFMGRSHFLVYEPVVVELARHGHDVTVISHFPRTDPLEHYTDIDIRETASEQLLVNLTEFAIHGLTLKRVIKEMNNYATSFEKVFNVTGVINLLNSRVKFDLIIVELFVSEMFIGLSHRFQAPLIQITSSVIPFQAADTFGISDNPSYIRVFGDWGAGPKTFFERFFHSIGLVGMKILYNCIPVFLDYDDKISKKYLGEDMPHVREMVKKTSLLFVNSHFSLNGARPYPPQIVEIGGIHIKPTQKLPQDIEKFINESEHGIIYFSLGSIAHVSTMSDPMKKAFINSFGKLKQRVLWKWELDEMPGKPDNVKIVKWMPQIDILAHPNVKTFIGHGGLSGTIEAAHFGVPMLGIPVFGDQYGHVATLVHAGSAILLELANITEDSLTEALHALLNDPKYKTNAKHLSDLFRDRLASPLDTAMYWIDYVMKHKGAHHLRTYGADLPWYQYLLLDVIAALILLILIVIAVVTAVFKLTLRVFCQDKKEKVQ